MNGLTTLVAPVDAETRRQFLDQCRILREFQKNFLPNVGLKPIRFDASAFYNGESSRIGHGEHK